MKVNLELTLDEINLVLEGLHELPAKMSINLIIKISEEAKRYLEEQNKPENI